MKCFIKICGLANAADVEATVACAPDALGFIFWAKSPRAVTPAQVGDWTRDLPAGLRKVGVFVDALPEEIKRSAEMAGLDVIQLHGDQMFEDLGLPVWKVLHLDRLPAGFENFPAEAYLIDSGTVDMPGGTGLRVDTERASAFVKQSKLPVVLAGGLKAGTVGNAIREVRPAGVDVSSGVELRPGQKDLGAVKDFIQQAREAFQHSN